MDIVITNVNGYTTISVKGKKAHIRQKREDFLKEDFNVFFMYFGSCSIKWMFNG